jgi:tetratricopeptide (TPR) repeat protein
MDHRGASVAFSPDGRRFVVGGLRGRRFPASLATLRDTFTGAVLFKMEGHSSTVPCVAYSPDGKRIVTGGGDQDRRALLWDATTGTVLHELKGHTSAVLCAAFSPDGKRVVTGSGDRTVRVWDVKTGMTLLEMKGFTDRMSSVAFTSDGNRLVTGEIGGAITLWDAPPRLIPPALHGHIGNVHAETFSPDGTRFAAGSNDRTVRVWDIRTGALLALKGHESTVQSVGFAPDGARLITGDGTTVRIWDTRTGEALLEMKGTVGVRTVAFSRDGTRIVTSDLNEARKVWDAGSGKELPGEAVPETVAGGPISPDGRFLARVDALGTSRIDLIPLKLDEEELAYRRLHTQPNLGRYRAGYEAARVAKDEVAAGFYLKLLPPDEQKVLKAEAAAEREIAAGRTQDAIAHLAIVSAARPDDMNVALKLATLRAWWRQDQELADLCGRALESARDTSDLTTGLAVAQMCCLRPTADKTRQEAALAMARRALELDNKNPLCRLAVGIALYRCGQFAEADTALIAATKGEDDVLLLVLVAPSSFYRAMILFRQGKPDEARKLATEGFRLSRLRLPQDENNPLAGRVVGFDLIVWLAYKEAKALIGFDAAPPPEKK